MVSIILPRTGGHVVTYGKFHTPTTTNLQMPKLTMDWSTRRSWDYSV